MLDGGEREVSCMIKFLLLPASEVAEVKKINKTHFLPATVI